MGRVVITGAGTVNPLGDTVDRTLAAFREGRCGIGPLEMRDSDRLRVMVGGQVRGWQPQERFAAKDLGLYDRVTQFALVAAAEAVAQSGLVFDGALAEQAGVILGNSGGGLTTIDDNYRAVYEERKDKVHPFVVPRLMNNAGASHISMIHGLLGPSFTVSSACASSNHAMGLAFHMVRAGMAPVMVTGGAEAMLCFGGLKAWEGLRVMATDACRPFSATRTGMVQGEGAGIFVFEDYDHARARGADILAEVAGFSMTSDAHNIVMPLREGGVRVMTRALADADIAADAIGYVNAHGTGTIVNDRTECAALHDVFGAHLAGLPVSSTKSMHGHLIGGTGAVELLACIMAVRDGVLAPTIGFEAPDPDCPIDMVPNNAREAKVAVAMSNAFAFGGMNAALILRRV